MWHLERRVENHNTRCAGFLCENLKQRPILALVSRSFAPAIAILSLAIACGGETQQMDCEGKACDSEPRKVSLGATHTPESTTFALWSPDHTDVAVSLEGQRYEMSLVEGDQGYDDFYEVVIPGDHHLATYHFEVNDVPVRDPYAKMAVPNSNDCVVMDMSQTGLPAGWAERPVLQHREDAIIYEVHVRDFSIAEDSGVSQAHRGKFLGMVETGTTRDGLTTGIDHLKELGVTHIQLMPVYDFHSCPDLEDVNCYNWGYDPRNYSVPEERYSLTPYDYENRALEFKRMVDEFHKAGLRVVMDVVYNHTHSKSMFRDISESYYTELDLSGTGNAIDANVPMVSRMIRDSLEYWVREYNIDGFRFDLLGVFGYDEVGEWATYLNATFPDRTLLLYGEPWNGNATDPLEASRLRMGTVGRIRDSRMGVFNAKFREAIKGQNDNGACHPGDCFAFNESPDTWRIEVGSRGGLRYENNANETIDLWDPMFALDPEQSINYVSAHDNLTLRDKILRWAENAEIDSGSAYLRRIQMFANGIVLTSQGIPFLHGGVELMRDKNGDHNSYKSSDEVNRYEWSWKAENGDVLAYYKDVIELRKAHPALRMTSWQDIADNVTTERIGESMVVHRIFGEPVGDSWSEIIVIYNSGINATFDLPAGEWKVAMEKSDPSAGGDRIVSATVVAEGTAVTILHR